VESDHRVSDPSSSDEIDEANLRGDVFRTTGRSIDARVHRMRGKCRSPKQTQLEW
jgi:hypothetical protein